MKKKSIVTFVFVVVAAILLDIVALFGLPGVLHDKYGGMFDENTGIRQGIDLAGGSVITFQAQANNPTDAEMETVKSIYETRLNGAGYTEARISVGEGGKVTIEIPTGSAPATEESAVEDTAKDAEKAEEAENAENAEAAKETEAAENAEDAKKAENAEKAENTEEAEAAKEAETEDEPTEASKSATEQTDEAVALLSQVAKLTFRDADGNVVLEGTDVKSAKSQYGQPTQNANSQYYVQVEFTAEGAKKFADATATAAAKASPNNIIQIVMDETIVSAPRVSEKIDSDSCVISGSFTAEEASRLANQINSGNLPFEMKKISQSTVGAELGSDALPTSQKAAAIGIVLVMLFMIWRYRVPGLVADLSLLIYTGLICLAMGVFHVNLSLSGIAGIVLSIGMAVDADCIIFERIKEELVLGKSIRAAVDSGFSKAFSAILDSNVTTIISCVVLYMSGIGTVTGFATTLGIGVILSMFTAILITKFLLKNLVNTGIENRNLFYNAKKAVGGAENE
ncbi:MAG: protein translocase subunit SecD [Clostridia bacterium]|nr:protein translocase subunit SecD [Clostridia bacterium]